jgi:hypothetical protein
MVSRTGRVEYVWNRNNVQAVLFLIWNDLILVFLLIPYDFSLGGKLLMLHGNYSLKFALAEVDNSSGILRQR